MLIDWRDRSPERPVQNILHMTQPGRHEAEGLHPEAIRCLFYAAIQYHQFMLNQYQLLMEDIARHGELLAKQTSELHQQHELLRDLKPGD